MSKLYDNYILLLKHIPRSEERGIKKIINTISRKIKNLKKSEPTPETEDLLKSYTFEKVLIQILFDGPDLTFSPSRYCKDNNLTTILKNTINMCASSDQKTNMLTLISIYKSLGIDEITLSNMIPEMHLKLCQLIQVSQKKDDLMLSKINDLQAHFKKAGYQQSIQEIQDIRDNWKRVEFFKELDIIVCIQYWTKYRAKAGVANTMIKS